MLRVNGDRTVERKMFNECRLLLARLLFLLLVPDMVLSLGYPVFATKRFGGYHLPSYVPMPVAVSQRYQEVPEYEDGYAPEEEDYPAYDRYPALPVYGYYGPGREEEAYGYAYEDRDPILDLQEEMRKEARYPYGQETWFEGGNPSFDVDSEANAAFLRNLVMAQRYQDAAVGGLREDDREWSYGVPVTEVDDGDESVRELESLRAKAKAKMQKSRLRKEDGSPSSKDEILRERLQKQFGRKSDERDLRKTQPSYQREDVKRSRDKTEATTTTTTTTTSAPSTLSPKRGQKEYVLPRPANPVRRPFETRSEPKASVYDTIKKLLRMEDELASPRLRKRFVMNEDQLTTELSGLKRISV